MRPSLLGILSTLRLRHPYAAVFMCVGALSAADAQSVTELPETQRCRRCVVRLSAPVRLGHTDGDGAFPAWPFNFHASIALDAQGNAFVGLRDGPNYAPFRFNALTGRFLGTVGRVGGGPGEFLFPGVIRVLPGDSLLVLDQNQHRYSVLAPRSFKWVRGGPMPGVAYDVLPLQRNTRFVVNSPLNMRQSAGLPLHLFDEKGNLLRSFGSDSAVLDPRDDQRIIRVLAASGDSAFWSANHVYDYRVDLFSADTRRLRSFHRTVSWFPKWSRKDFRPTTPTSPPMPFLTSVREAEDGTLWIAIAIADRNWASGLSAPKRGERGTLWYDIEDWSRVYDTMIEVIDPKRNEVIVSHRIDDFVVSLLPGGRVAAVHIQDLQPFLLIYRATVADSFGQE